MIPTNRLAANSFFSFYFYDTTFLLYIFFLLPLLCWVSWLNKLLVGKK